MTTENFPEDWILPGEFSFGPGGEDESLRVGSSSMSHHRPKPKVEFDDALKDTELVECCPTEESLRDIESYEDEGRWTHLFMWMLATSRKNRGLPPNFWKDKPDDKSWDEWMYKFPIYHVDYKHVPRRYPWESQQ